jgi:hypothetical protein
MALPRGRWCDGRQAAKIATLAHRRTTPPGRGILPKGSLGPPYVGHPVGLDPALPTSFVLKELQKPVRLSKTLAQLMKGRFLGILV